MVGQCGLIAYSMVNGIGIVEVAPRENGAGVDPSDFGESGEQTRFTKCLRRLCRSWHAARFRWAQSKVGRCGNHRDHHTILAANFRISARQ